MIFKYNAQACLFYLPILKKIAGNCVELTINEWHLDRLPIYVNLEN